MRFFQHAENIEKWKSRVTLILLLLDLWRNFTGLDTTPPDL